MAQDDSIDTRLPYRIGYPKLPVLPVRGLCVLGDWTTYVPNYSSHAQNIGEVLQRHGVNYCNCRLEHRFNDGGQYNQNLPTILLLAYFQPTSQDTIYNLGWIQGVQEICEILHAANISNPVELIDPLAYSDSLRPSPILSSDYEIIQECKEIKSELYQAIENQDWISVDVFYRDFPHTSQEVPMALIPPFINQDGTLNYPEMSHSYKKPTLVICARDANEEVWWSTILPQLRLKLKRLDVVVLFLQDLLFTAGFRKPSKPWNLVTLARTAYYPDRKNIVFMGDSCAPKGSAHSCTLGGKVTLKDGEQKLEMGITNWHCLQDGTKNGSKQPVDPGHPQTDSPRVVVSISDQDHEYVKEHVQAEISEDQAMLPSYQKTLEAAKEGTSEHQIVTLSVQDAQNRIRSWEHYLDYIETFPRDIGTVYANSDFRVSGNPFISDPSRPLGGIPRRKDWLLDWALIKMKAPTVVSSVLQRVPSYDLYSEEGLRTHIPDNFNVTEYATISPDENLNVMKRGRTSGWTYGTTSAVPSTQRSSTRGDSKPTTPAISRDKSLGNVACCSIIRQPDVREQFLELGDSGSLILLNEKSNPGVIVGLGFADNPSSKVSYMLPMDLVVRDIEDTTGMKVLEPKYAGVVRKAA